MTTLVTRCVNRIASFFQISLDRRVTNRKPFLSRLSRRKRAAVLLLIFTLVINVFVVIPPGAAEAKGSLPVPSDSLMQSAHTGLFPKDTLGSFLAFSKLNDGRAGLLSMAQALSSSLLSVNPLSPPPPDPVTWINKVNTTSTSTTLSKSGGCNGCTDSGATSQEQLSSGDGYMEFTASSGSYGYIGLGTSTGSTTTHTEVNFGINFDGTTWTIREIGWSYKDEGSYSANDVFRIGVESGEVVYRKNGSVIYTSATSPSYPLVVDTSLMPSGANIYNTTVSFGGGGATPTPTSTPTPTPTPPPSGAVIWIEKVNVTDTSTTLTKTGGCDGCTDAGAISQQQLSSGEGYMEFTASSGTYGYIGLGTSTGSTSTHTEINFGITFSGGNWTIREIGWSYKDEGSYSNNDVFRIGVEGGQVKYRKNGTLIYTSATSPSYPLVVDTSLMPSGANIYNTTVSFGGGGATPTPTPTQTATPTPTPTPTPAPNLVAARLHPKNATGGTNVYSQNFGWGTSLVSLPGRSGLDLNLGLSYNSLVWIKDGSSIYFNPDSNNVSPGFQFAFPIVEPAYYDSVKSKWIYLMVTPSGERVEFRSTGVDYDYETVNSTYAKLVTASSSSPTSLTVTSTDGTQMSYALKGGLFKCTKIMDRNGNYISNAYNPTHHVLETVTDTLGRVITINYENNVYPTTITQTWYPNGNGSGTPPTWATLSYTKTTLNVSFATGLTLQGATNNSSIKVLDKITYADGSATKFDYNGYLQVTKVSKIAADSPSHVLNYTSTNLDAVSGTQQDCPRFTSTKIWAESFNVVSGTAQPVTVTNSAPASSTFSSPNGNEATSVVKIEVVNHPNNNLYTRQHFGPSGYLEGLTIATEDCIGTDSSCSDRKRWSWNEFTQDNTSLSYILNPRIYHTQIGDGVNTKKTTVEYLMQSGSSTISRYGLVSAVYEWDQGSALRTTETTYNLSENYVSRRIIGLPSQVSPYQGVSTLVSRVSFAYDENGYTGSGQSVSATQHDSSYGTGLTYRGNQTSATRQDVTGSTSSSVSATKYNITGSPITRTDPRGRVTTFGYSDSFTTTGHTATFAYPTTLTDPAGYSSTIKYRYDMGANVEVVSPNGKTTTRAFYSDGRLERETLSGSGVLSSYTRYVYPNTGNVFKSFSTLIDADTTSGGSTGDEVESETHFDGAGRVIKRRVPHTFDTSGNPVTWSATQTIYDIVGRAVQQSVPTEVDSSWGFVSGGDDTAFRYNSVIYDWRNRPEKTWPTGSNGSDGKETLYTYSGCGCAGGQVTTIKGPMVDAVNVSGTSQTDKRRTQKTYEDILGRVVKTEVWDLDGAGSAPYSTVRTKYNVRDQVTNVLQYAGAETPTSCPTGTCQETTMSYDGHGRLSASHRPEQNGSTSYIYFADDSIEKITDARGAETVYTYENVSGSLKRNLVTKIEWNVPQNSGITDPTDVVFTYNNMGQRSQMTDGLGVVDYSYNSISQLTSESRNFTDSLAEEPSTGLYTISYSYALGGQLKSYTDPWGKQIAYSDDKAGKLSQVTGTVFGGVDEYAKNPVYRAWGALKSLNYGDADMQTSLTYDSQLRPATHLVNQASSPNNKTFDKSYQYDNNGLLKLNDESISSLNRFDRSFKYDFAGRVIEAKSGIEATTSQTETDLINLPYRQSYTHNAFGQVTSRDSTLWDYTGGGWDFDYAMVNNRDTGANYDNDGRQTTDSSSDPIIFSYDAAGKMRMTWRTEAYETKLHQDGDGVETKREQRTWDTNASNWKPWEWVYFINSTVLGQVVSEATKTGKKKYTYVIANGATLAQQAVDTANNESVTWQFQDASGYSARGFNAKELDALGNNVGTIPNFRNTRGENALTVGQTPTFDNQDVGDCQFNGTFMPCSLAYFMEGGNSFLADSFATGLPVQAGSRYHQGRNNPMGIANSIRREFEFGLANGPFYYVDGRPRGASYSQFDLAILLGSQNENLRKDPKFLDCPERDKVHSLPAQKALELYTDGRGNPAYISIDEIMAEFPLPSSFAAIKELVKAGTKGKSSVLHRVQGIHSAAVQTQGWQAAVLGRITFDLAGTLKVYEFGLVEFVGTIGVIPDIYDFDAGDRGVLAQLSTAAGSLIPGKPYDIITVGRYDVLQQWNKYGTSKNSCKKNDE